MAKTEVYSWRLSADMKTALEREAKRANQSVGRLLDHIVEQWMDAAKRSNDSEEPEQLRLHEAASRWLGAPRRGNPYRAEQARRAIRARLAGSHARRRPH
jgi:uncharacterized damage-inducible protein DinB